ncbi:uncharacterized protein LOC144468973 [Augochlora pura]
MVVDQKCKLDLKTPTVPDFSMKTPQTNSSSLKSRIHSNFPDSTTSNYVSLPSSASHKKTHFRSVLSSRSNADSLRPRSNSRQLDVIKEQEEQDSKMHSSVNYMVEDMELTGDEDEVVHNIWERRPYALKKVRLSDQYESTVESSTRSNLNVSENEEFFEACDTLADPRTQVYDGNTKNIHKENCKSNGDSAGANKSPKSARVVMLMIVENSSPISINKLISTSLKKLECITSETNQCDNHSSSTCNLTTRTADYGIASQKSCSASNSAIEVDSGISSFSNSHINSTSFGGLFSTVANAVKSVVNCISAMTATGNMEREDVSQRDVSRRDSVEPESSTSDTFVPMSQFVTSLLEKSKKRRRIALGRRSSPMPKRPCGKIKGRDPLPRMLSTSSLLSATLDSHKRS